MASRKIQDDSLIRSKALPAADAANETDSFDLGQAEAHPVNESIDFKVSIPDAPALVEDKTITFTLEDSADDSTFAAIPQLATFVVTGKAGNGLDATARTYKLPGSTRRYVRVKVAVEADGGDNTGVSYSAQILT